MQYLAYSTGNWQMIPQGNARSTQASGANTVQIPALQTYAAPQEPQTGEQTLADLLKQQSQSQSQSQASPFGQNYLRQYLAPAPTNYFQQLY